MGFIPLHQAGDNTRKVIDLIHVANRDNTESLILSLDAEKVFDCPGWPFMLATLSHMGFRGTFLRAVQHLYTNPTSQVKTPFATSPTFPATNGTHQGYPLSPVRFALCVEPLVATIRRNPDIRCISVRGKEFKTSLFADDIILTLTQPRISLPNLHTELDKYGELSRYKMNASKSMALPLKVPEKELLHLQSEFPYNWERISLKYLGVNLTPSFDSLYQANFPPLYKSIRELIQKWKTHQISLLGRIASVKMVLLS